MPARRPPPTALAAGALLLAGALVVLLRPPDSPPRPPAASAPIPAPAFAPGPPPGLLPPRPATAEQPALARDRLLAADGSPEEDLLALADLIDGYLHSGLGDTRRSLGFNEDLVAALTDRTALGDAALPSDHPALRAGRLLDRWGTPWQIHPRAADAIDVRSAGPDRRLYTPDDLTNEHPD